MKYYRGLIIVEPHGSYIASNNKKIIIKVKKLLSLLNKPLLLIENKKALGYIKLTRMDEIDEKKYNQLKKYHLITDTEKTTWWPNHKKFYSYYIEIIKIYKKPKNIDYPQGPQVTVKPENIKFI